MGKYQKILAKSELSYDDVLVLGRAGKIKEIISALVCVRHAGSTYLKLISRTAYEYIQNFNDNK